MIEYLDDPMADYIEPATGTGFCKKCESLVSGEITQSWDFDGHAKHSSNYLVCENCGNKIYDYDED